MMLHNHILCVNNKQKPTNLNTHTYSHTPTSQQNKQNRTPFTIDFKKKSTNSETTIIQQYLQQWCKIQKFETKYENQCIYCNKIFTRKISV